MKKIIIVLAVFISSITQAQQEVSVDLGDALVMKTLELSYEYYLNEQSAIGASILFNLNGENSDLRYNEESMLTAFYRHYFFDSGNLHYFGEVFFGINSGEKEKDEEITKYTDGALGVGIGAKYVSQGGLMISALGGIGRNLFNNNSYEFVPRVGLNIGYRF